MGSPPLTRSPQPIESPPPMGSPQPMGSPASRSRPEIGKNLPKFVKHQLRWVELGQTLAEPGQHRPKFARHRSEVGRSQPAFGRTWSNFSRKRPKCVRKRSEFGQNLPKVGQASATSARNQTNFGRHRQGFGRSMRPNLVELNLEFKLCPRLADIGPNLAEIDLHLVEPCPNLVDITPNPAGPHSTDVQCSAHLYSTSPPNVRKDSCAKWRVIFRQTAASQAGPPTTSALIWYISPSSTRSSGPNFTEASSVASARASSTKPQ